MIIYNKRKRGAAKEETACIFLKNKGYEIIERNYSYKHGEIDIIARKEDILVFVEVKYRSSIMYGMPYEAVDYKKQQRIINASKYYMLTHGISDTIIRYDVISILQDEITHYKDAFWT